MTAKNEKALEELRDILEAFFTNYPNAYNSEKSRKYLNYFDPNYSDNINVHLDLPSPLRCILDLSDLNIPVTEEKKINKYNDLCLEQIDIVIKYLRRYGYGAKRHKH